jgi:hypothetical protein
MKKRLALVVAAAALAAAGLAGGWHWSQYHAAPKAGWAWGDAAVSEDGTVSQADASDAPAAAYDGWAW